MEKDTDEIRKRLIQKLKKERNWSLNYHRLLLDTDPEILEKWDDLYSTAKFHERFISAREREIMELGINAVLKWDMGLQIHLKKAVDLGVTEQEIMEVFSLIAMTAGIPCMMFAANVYAEMKANNFEYSFPQCEIVE